jgi:hypothetical protein
MAAPEEEEEQVPEELSAEDAARSTLDPEVDAMVTSLEDDIEPFPGPPIAEEPAEEVDSRPIFAHVGQFVSGQQPGAALQEAYTDWLGGSSTVCLPHYMMARETFGDYWMLGEVLTDEDMAVLDAKDEELAAQAAEAGESAEAALTMESTPVALVLGHLTVARSENWDEAAEWAAADPVAVAGGYEKAALLQWLISDDAQLRRRPAGEQQQTYVVYCRDRADAGDLRTQTRPAHLEWLVESGRVCLAGPLLDRDDDAATPADGPRVGTLLMVNGDDLDDVTTWAAADPYATAGLFDSVLVAPLASYAEPKDTLPLFPQLEESPEEDEDDTDTEN